MNDVFGFAVQYRMQALGGKVELWEGMDLRKQIEWAERVAEHG